MTIVQKVNCTKSFTNKFTIESTHAQTVVTRPSFQLEGLGSRLDDMGVELVQCIDMMLDYITSSVIDLIG